MTEPLSPAAQAVWNAYLNKSEWDASQCELNAVAAVLRAVADQVVPIEHELIDDCWYEKSDLIRKELLTIAAELETVDA